MILFIKHEGIEGPGTLGYFFNATCWATETVELWKGENLPPLDKCEAVISMGGPMNVYEEEKYPFLVLEDEFLRGAIERHIPTLGICLGAQLLAKCEGAEVRKADCKEIGWHKVSFTKEAHSDPLFNGLSNSLDVFQWHEDTFDIPKKGRLLATSEICKNQAMRIDKYAWGLQFHPELTLQMIEDWVDYYDAAFDKNRFIDGYLKNNDRYYMQAQLLYRNFANTIAKEG